MGSYDSPTSTPVAIPPSQRTPGPVGSVSSPMRPVEGRKELKGSSEVMRHSMAWPVKRTSSCVHSSFSPAAMRICHCTRSTPITSSVTGCSTWMRVFISRK